MHKKHQRGDNSKSIKARALIFVRDTSSRPVLHNYEVSAEYSKRYSLLSGHENVNGRTDG